MLYFDICTRKGATEPGVWCCGRGLQQVLYAMHDYTDMAIIEALTRPKMNAFSPGLTLSCRLDLPLCDQWCDRIRACKWKWPRRVVSWGFAVSNLTDSSRRRLASGETLLCENTYTICPVNIKDHQNRVQLVKTERIRRLCVCVNRKSENVYRRLLSIIQTRTLDTAEVDIRTRLSSTD